MLKNWCFWTVMLEKTLESPLDCKEIQPVHPRGVKSWMFIGSSDAEAETPILWPPHMRSWLTGKDPDAGRDWGQEEKGMTEDEMAGWHHWFDGRVWVNSGSWWWTGRPGVLRFMGSQRVGHDWAAKLNWTEPYNSYIYFVTCPVQNTAPSILYIKYLESLLHHIYNLLVQNVRLGFLFYFSVSWCLVPPCSYNSISESLHGFLH